MRIILHNQLVVVLFAFVAVFEVLAFFQSSIKAQTIPPNKTNGYIPWYDAHECDSVALSENDLVHCSLSSNLFQKLRAKNGVAVIARQKGDFQKAMVIWDEILIEAGKTKLANFEMVGFNNKGTLFRRLDRLNEAVEAHLAALRIAEMNEYSSDWLVLKSKCVAFNGLGNVSLSMGNLPDAIGYFNNALVVEKSLGSELGLAINKSNLGAIYQMMQMSDSAMLFYMQSLQHNQNAHSKLGVAICRTNIGELLVSMGKPHLAVPHLNQALMATDSLGDSFHWLAACVAFSKAHIALGNYTMAEMSIGKSIERARFSGSLYFQSVNYELLSQLNELQGDLAGAILNLKNGYAYLDSINSMSNFKTIEELKLKYDSDKKELEIKNLKNEKRLNQLFLVIAIVVGLVILVYAYMFLALARSRKKSLLQSNLLLEKEKELGLIKQRNLELEIDRKNRELVASVLQLSEKNQLIVDIKNAGSDNGLSKDLLRSLDHFVNTEKAWEAFCVHFEGVHPRFLLNLKQRYPELSVKDERLCAFLRLNLATKEIAQLLNVTVAAVDKSRNRLRKKLELSADVNLYEFLSSFELEYTVFCQ